MGFSFPGEGGRKTVMWNLVGLALALLLAAAAYVRSRSLGGFYDAGVYGMVPSTHRRYALISLAFAGFFAVALATRIEPASVVGLGLFTLVAIFYVTSFLRGYADHDE